MESLSEILKSVLDPSRLQQAEEKSRQLLADPLVVKWRMKYPQVTDSELKLNMNRVYQYIKEYNSCSRCPGLEDCPNDMQGHYTLLSAETVNGATHIYDQKVSCKKFMAKQAQDAIRSRIRSFYVDERSLEQGYSADEILTMDRKRVKAVNALMKYIDETKENGLLAKGLYLSGSFGTGKTFLMCYMLHELAKAGYTGAIVYMPDFSEDLKAMFNEPARLKDTIDMLKDTDLLIFDDIGAENMNPWLRDHVLGTILNYRMNRKPTFFTSNYDLDGLEKHFSFTSRDGEEEFKGQRIMDRIRHFVDVIAVTGANKRGR
ncbi:primosomal protein DnaI [Paenibacillus aurantius]|uniref:Primosomal protein DnaI n=1 Tax=Paenibacillus aurantius TaxID=2918900 RepID=A0AA96LIK9_9BACL|nr:primosomal protein DnaI [Paenibacillus aurantius]WJH32266.1 primosomal protein DnaI [Paenibacillus sp. CC-CFT747]WNQ12646.1 primosomal protein DnaI [Paenibacillus aurantius]